MGNNLFEAYADANWADNSTDLRSFTGYVVKSGGAAISWESRKQRTVALSTTESEFYALSNVAGEIMFLMNVQEE